MDVIDVIGDAQAAINRVIVKDDGESYKHAAAKEIMAQWIRDTCKGSDDYWSFGGMSLRPNRGAPWHGVFTEYPLTGDTFFEVWDECGRFECEHSIEHGECPNCDCKTWPDYQWMIDNGYQNFYIADIALQHKGCIPQVIEIVHKNFLSREKACFYAMHDCSCVVVSADWILNQIQPPEQISGLVIEHGHCHSIGGGLFLNRQHISG